MIVKDIRSSKNGIFIKYEDNTWKQFDYEWYFYIEKEQLYLVPASYVKRFEVGNEFVKLFCDNRTARMTFLPLLQSMNIRTYEGDFKPEERYKYDHELEISKAQDVLYFDIETDDRQRKIEIGRDYIMSWVAIDNKGNKFSAIVETLDEVNEKRIIKEFYDLCRNYDIIAGWNIMKFDTPYFKARGDRYDLRFPNVGQYDLFTRTKHIYRFDSNIKSFSLENISQVFLGEGKIKHQGTYDLWTKGELLTYNERDVELTKRIDEKLKISEMMILQSTWCKSFPRKFSLYALIDSVITQQSHKLRRPVPTNYKALLSYSDKNTDEEFEKYMGAEVLDPQIGYRENVTVFDFKSLYPSIMMTCNIGFDTLNYEDGIKCPGTSFVERGGKLKPTYFKTTPSCIAETIKHLIGLRNTYKKLKFEYIEKGWTTRPEYQKVVSDEIIVKELSNSVYGIMGMQFGRYYNLDVAESITLTGRWILNFAKQSFIRMGHQVIYGDTDSIFIHSKGQLDVEGSLEIFHNEINTEMRDVYNIQEPHIQLNFDKHYLTFMIFAKKNYVGLCDNMEGKATDILYVRGMEYIKRNTFKFAAKCQKELIENILRQKIPISDVLEQVREYKSLFHRTQFTQEELELSVRINKEEYTGNSISAFLSKQILEETGVNPEGTEVKYIITKCGKSLTGIQSHKYNGSFSREYYWQNATRNMLDKVLQLVNPGACIEQNLLF